MEEFVQVPGLANCWSTAQTVDAMRHTAIARGTNVTRIAVLTMKSCTVEALRAAVRGPVSYPVAVIDTPIGQCAFGRRGDGYLIQLETR